MICHSRISLIDHLSMLMGIGEFYPLGYSSSLTGYLHPLEHERLYTPRVCGYTINVPNIARIAQLRVNMHTIHKNFESDLVPVEIILKFYREYLRGIFKLQTKNKSHPHLPRITRDVTSTGISSQNIHLVLLQLPSIHGDPHMQFSKFWHEDLC